MYFIANLQPKLPDSHYEKYGFLTNEQKKIIIDKHAQNLKKGFSIDLCDEHGGGNKPGFQLKNDQKIGKIHDMIISQKGDLIVTGEMFGNNNKTPEMIKELLDKKSKDYGVSIWLDLEFNKDKKTFDNKKLNHVAITKSPGLGEYGAYIYEWSYNKNKIDNILKDNYYKFNDKENGSRYASLDLKNSWFKGNFKNFFFLKC